MFALSELDGAPEFAVEYDPAVASGRLAARLDDV
jgi:hypothetical protein